MEQVTTAFTQWTHLALVWIGFGTLVGLLAKAIFPGKDPGGAFPTLMIGIFGSVIGASVLMFVSGARVTPISVEGFLVAIAGTMLILFSYRLLGGKGFGGIAGLRGWRRGRRKISVVEEK